MSWRERDLQYQQPPRRQSTAEYNLNGGRNAFRMASAFSEAWDAADAIDATEILRQHSAMRSFTESVDSDLPPAPELPQSLDIDYQYPTPSMTESDTGDTIVEVLRKAPEDDAATTDYDKTLGATQKYPMMVPGPGHVDAEQEMHESLLAKEEESSESDLEVREQLRNVEQVITAAARRSGAPRKAKTIDSDHEALRRGYSVSAIQRPRPTTPTSWCAIENYIEGSSTTVSTTHDRSVPPDAGAKIRVSIPQRDGARPVSRRRKSSMSWSDFYECMAAQLPHQARSQSLSGRASPMYDYDGDILEEDPRYKKMAPPKPVIHRWSSTEWENFEEDKSKLQGTTMDQAKIDSIDGEMQRAFVPISDHSGALPADSAFTMNPQAPQVVPNVQSEETTRASIGFESDNFAAQKKPDDQVQLNPKEEMQSTTLEGDIPQSEQQVQKSSVAETAAFIADMVAGNVSTGTGREGMANWTTSQSVEVTVHPEPSASLSGTAVDESVSKQLITETYTSSATKADHIGETSGLAPTDNGQPPLGYDQNQTSQYAAASYEQQSTVFGYPESSWQSYDGSSYAADPATAVQTTDQQQGAVEPTQSGAIVSDTATTEQNYGAADTSQPEQRQPEPSYSSTSYGVDGSYSASTYGGDASAPQSYDYQQGVTAADSQYQSTGFTTETSYSTQGYDQSQYQYDATSSSYPANQVPDMSQQYATNYYGAEYGSASQQSYASGKTTESFSRSQDGTQKQWQAYEQYGGGQASDTSASYEQAPEKSASYEQASEMSASARTTEIPDADVSSYRPAPVVPQFTAPLLSESFSRSQDGAAQQQWQTYEQYGGGQASDKSVSYEQASEKSASARTTETSDAGVSGYRPAPVIPQFMPPLLPELNRYAAPIDPFSWEAQEQAAASSYVAQQPASASNNFASPVQSSQIPSQTDETQRLAQQTETIQQYSKSVEHHVPQEEPKKLPPPRPVPPPPSLHISSPTASPTIAAAPHRPPPPSPKVPPKKPPPPNLTEHPSPQVPRKPLPAPQEPEEDAWTQFKKMTEKANVAMKSTEEKLKKLEETTAVKEIKDESYLAEVGGLQGYVPELAQKQIKIQQEMIAQKKAEKKKVKEKSKKRAKTPEFNPAQEDDMDRAAQQLAMKMAAGRVDLGDWKPPSERDTPAVPTEEQPEKPARQTEQIPQSNAIEEQQTESAEVPSASEQNVDTPQRPIEDAAQQPEHSGWAGFGDNTEPELPPSESGFFATADLAVTAEGNGTANGLDIPSDPSDPFATKKVVDPFAPVDENLFTQSYDPFDVRSAEDLVEAAKERAAAEVAAAQAQEDVDFFGGGIGGDRHSVASSPTPEGGSPASSRPTGFEDEFRVDDDALSTPSPLYDEDDSEPLTEFPTKFAGDGWELMVRHPIKKKMMGDRYWKPCFIKLIGSTLQLCNSRTDQKPFQEIVLQATYSLSDTTLQAYDVYGKIHTVKLQYVLYKERVGIRPGQISRLVEGHITKYGLPLEHSAQCTVLLKFGSLNAGELSSFVATVEDVLFKCIAKRDTAPIYKQDEVQVHCYDEYYAYVDKHNILSDQKARVRLFCLAFLSGSPLIEVGLNDRRRQGKEIVRRKDILPMYTERWIRFENVEFHNTVDAETFDKEQVIRFSPPDGCFFEVMRFRIRPPRNREKPLSVNCVMKIAGSKIEIRLEAMVAAQTEKTKGGRVAKRQIPCEDIQIRFPIPEAWIYLFREERHWGVGSVHAKVRRPGKVKNLKDRLMGTVQNIENSLIEAAIGEAKYEHVYRSLVWRIPRLPEKHHAAYKQHLLRCRFELSSFDLMPETFLPTCDVEFTMPLATISNTVVRSVSVEQHEDSDRVEKFVRYVAKCNYKVEIDYVQCTDLDIDAILDMTNVNPDASQEAPPEAHKPAINPADVDVVHGGYGIDFSEAEIGAAKPADSSSDEDDDDKKKMPIIQIDMKGYQY